MRFFLNITKSTTQINTVATEMIEKACAVCASGTLTFIPKKPDMIVGTAITNVMAVKYFMTLFSRLSITEDNSSLVPLIISR